MAEMKRSNANSVPVPDPTVLTTAALIREIDSLRERTTHDNGQLRELIETRLDEGDKAVELLRATTDMIPERIFSAVTSLKSLIDSKFETVHEITQAIKVRVEERQKIVEASGEYIIDLIDEKIDGRISERIGGKVELLSEKINSLSNVTTQQLKSIDATFAEKDKAVSVGLSTQSASASAQQEANKEANRKMEDNFTKLLDQGRELLNEVRKNTDVQIQDIKSRLDKGEGRTSVGDPIVAEGISKLNAALIDLTKSRDTNQGYGLGQAGLWGLIVGGLGLLFGLGSTIAVIMK